MGGLSGFAFRFGLSVAGRLVDDGAVFNFHLDERVSDLAIFLLFDEDFVDFSCRGGWDLSEKLVS